MWRSGGEVGAREEGEIEKGEEDGDTGELAVEEALEAKGFQPEGLVMGELSPSCS